MSKNFTKRVLTSILLLSILVIINFSHQFIFLSSIIILGVIICIESNTMISKLVSPDPHKNSNIFKKISFKFLITNLLIFCYIFFIFCNFSYEMHNIEGPLFFIYIISICCFTDIGGYAFGKIIGGRKLTKISPNKTVSGTIGSFIFSIIPLIFFYNFSHLNLELNFKNVLFNLIVSLISQLGDLFISYIKRKANVKDTGKILPGHGGVLDRVDGIIFAVPFSYFLLKFI